MVNTLAEYLHSSTIANFEFLKKELLIGNYRTKFKLVGKYQSGNVLVWHLWEVGSAEVYHGLFMNIKQAKEYVGNFNNKRGI